MAYHIIIKTNVKDKDGKLIDQCIAGFTKEDAENLIDLISNPETKFINLTKYASNFRHDGRDYQSIIFNRDCILEADIIKGERE